MNPPEARQSRCRHPCETRRAVAVCLFRYPVGPWGRRACGGWVPTHGAPAAAPEIACVPVPGRAALPALSSRRRASLARDLPLVVGLKLLALVVLYLLFFSPSHRPPIDPAARIAGSAAFLHR